MNVGLWFLFSALFCFVGTAVAGRILIPRLIEKKMGQKILAIGPRWHVKKEGTPTMGGLAFVLPVVLAGLLGCSVLLNTGPKRTDGWILGTGRTAGVSTGMEDD